MQPLAIDMRKITKRFGNLVANDQIDFQVEQGEIHVLLGENGAGKSTLMNILFGLYQADEGQIFINGEEVKEHSPARALTLGLGMVHQHFMLVERLTVLENIILGFEPGEVLVDFAASRAKIQALVDEYHFHLDLDAKVEDLPVGVKQRVEIVKTLYRGADIIIFDEPTAVLTPPEVEELFQVFHELIKHNKTIVFITHKLNETMTVAHRISVLRNGRKIRTLAREETTPEELARLMVGREVAFDLEKSPCRPGKTILALQKVQLLPKAARTVDLEVRAGEIVGIAGVEGNGQLELEEMIMGLMPCPGGKILFNGQDITGLSVRERKSLGMAHIPSDRHKRAMLAGFSLEENLLLGRQFRPEWVRRGVIRQQALRQSCRQLIETFKIKASGAQQKIKFLSGGNQQKVILAREVSAGPELILAAQPTRGLDIGAIEYIHKLLLELRDQGKGILLISAELPEIMKLSDRIAVLYEGEIRALGPAEEFTQEELGLLMAGRERGEAS